MLLQKLLKRVKARKQQIKLYIYIDDDIVHTPNLNINYIIGSYIYDIYIV